LKGKLLGQLKGETFSQILNEALQNYIKENQSELRKLGEVVKE